MSEQAYILPRRDLREPAFRRYEYLISKACKGQVTVNPADYKQSANTLMLRFKDAVLGFKRYRYMTNIVPVDHPLKFKLHELSDGQVLIMQVEDISQAMVPIVFDREWLLKHGLPGIKTGAFKGIKFQLITDEDFKWLEEQKATQFDIYNERKGMGVEIT